MLSRKQFLQAFTLASFALLCVSGRPAPAVLKAPRYRLVELPPLPGHNGSVAFAVNSEGVVVGDSDNTAVCWKNEKPFALGDFGKGSQALAINTRGQIVGGANNPDGEWHAVLWDADKKIQDLGKLGGSSSQAFGINDSGVIVGNSERGSKDHHEHAFRWYAGHMIALKTPRGETSSQANGINNKGEIAGDSDGAHSNPRAVVWSSRGSWSFVGGEEAEIAHAINDKSEIAGSMDNRHDGPLRPFFWSKGKLRMLDLPVTERSLISYSINNDGLMVGISSDGARGEHTAVLYQHGQMYDLNTLIGDGQTLVMTFAMQINAKGYIVGWGKRDGKRRAFMLVPQSAQ